ncbi:hypothetical protein FRC02_005142 [Tulasnella sp. 418]|nr:hypothetical protein FRC02_005142 [Tulasnella sp. 418]
MSTAGRKENFFISKHFTKRVPQGGSSQRWFYSCDKCQTAPSFDDTTKLLLHRDNNLLNHLIHKCPKTTPDLKAKALAELSRKSGIPQDEPVLSTFMDSASSSSKLGTQTITSKKRKTGSETQQRIGSFLEKPMTEDEKQKADVQFLRNDCHIQLSHI